MSLDLEDIERMDKESSKKYDELKYVNNEEVYVYRYDNFNRLLSILWNLPVLGLGVIFFFLSENFIFKILGIFIFIYIICLILNRAFFKSLEVYKDKVIIEWFFFNNDLIYKEDLALNIIMYYYNVGNVVIRNKDKKVKSFLFFQISIFALRYYSLSENHKKTLKNLEEGY